MGVVKDIYGDIKDVGGVTKDFFGNVAEGIKKLFGGGDSRSPEQIAADKAATVDALSRLEQKLVSDLVADGMSQEDAIDRVSGATSPNADEGFSTRSLTVGGASFPSYLFVIIPVAVISGVWYFFIKTKKRRRR